MGKDIDNWIAEHGEWSRETVDRYKRVLMQITGDGLDLKRLKPESLSKWLQVRRWGSSTQWMGLCAIRSYLRWRYGSNHPALRLRLKRLDCGPQRTLTFDEVLALLKTFDPGVPKGIRDLAILSLMLDAGLRASEICRIELRYLRMDQNRLDVLIKGRQWGMALYSDHTCDRLKDWLKIRDNFARCNYLFVSLRGRTPGKSLTRQGLSEIVDVWGKVAALPGLSPHVFRRTFAVLATQAGAPSRLLQVAGRWSQIAMVERYTRAITMDDFKPYLPMDQFS